MIQAHLMFDDRWKRSRDNTAGKVQKEQGGQEEKGRQRPGKRPMTWLMAQ
jgi:hypothetical protein